MKNKIIFSIILSAIILTACKSEPSLIDEIETSETTAAAQAVQVVQGETKSDENQGEVSCILGGETETETTTATVTETTEETEPADKEAALDVRKIDINDIFEGDKNLNRLFFIKDAAAIGTYGGSGEICFFNLDDQTVKGRISPPDGWEFKWNYHCIEGSGDILCRIGLSRYNSEKNDNEYGVLVVYNDFSTEVIEDEPEKNLAIPVGGHNISDIAYNIYDADSGEIIVEGFNDTETELGFDSKWFDYKFQIDDDRFVYKICAFEAMPGFGYYDFTEGKAVDFPDSKDSMPVGYHNGKIYAKETWWDGDCQGDMYTFDIETLEKEHFMSSLVEFETDPDFIEYMEYSMSPNGEYIVAVHRKYNYKNAADAKTTFYIISPDSGEALAKYEFNAIDFDYNVEFINDNCFATHANHELIIFDVTM